jgi:hypothetical protein
MFKISADKVNVSLPELVYTSPSPLHYGNGLREN